MAKGIRFKYTFDKGSATSAYDRAKDTIANNTQRAMTITARDVKEGARADIARAGFSRRWQNSLRVNVHPTLPKKSMRAAIYLYHRIPYAGVFADGANIHGKPLLWVPLSSAPERIGRQAMTPANFSQGVGELVSMESRSGTPLLGVSVRLSKAKAQEESPKVSLAAMRRGDSGTGVPRTIPVFYGIRGVSIRKKLNIRDVCKRARDRIPGVYASNFKQ